MITRFKFNFSKAITFITLLYVIRVVERVMDMMEGFMDLSPTTYLLPGILAWGTLVLRAYYNKAGKENALKIASNPEYEEEPVNIINEPSGDANWVQ